jgi:kynureninase
MFTRSLLRSSVCDVLAEVVTKLMTCVGAEPSEVACMSTLTTNLHLMMSTFYRPTKERFKILCEAHAFPSDQVSAPSSPTLNGRLTRGQYAFISQVKRHGLDVDSTLIEMSALEVATPYARRTSWTRSPSTARRLPSSCSAGFSTGPTSSSR